MNWNNNIILMTDSYKISHWNLYPENTTQVYSYFESRVGSKFPSTLFFGLQYFLKNYLEGQVVTQEKIDEAEEIFNLHFRQKIFNRNGWEYILNKHNGYLPVKIKAIPEGMIVPESNVLMTVENTDPNCYWITNYLETLLVQIWYSCTVATQSKVMKNLISSYLEDTGDINLLPFKMNDFGYRGTSSPEQAGLGGAAHLVNFQGTDTLAGVLLARKFYNAKMPGFSIPATEHSTITSWGKEHEIDAMRNMLEKYPNGLIACVSDSFDIFNACKNYWGTELKEKVLARDGTLVVRPDSGDPPVIVLQVLNILGERFGFSINEKGYKVLNPKVRVIQGDGIDFKMLDKILLTMKENQWSIDNIAFGSGGGLLQKDINRDTQRFAFKCSSVFVNGEERDVYKQPITGSDKASKRGKLKLIWNNNQFKTVNVNDSGEDLMKTVFENGKITKEYSFDEIRRKSS